MDNRLIPKWDTSIAKKRRKYKVIKTEDFERYQRIIAHYDNELKKYKDILANIYTEVKNSNYCWPFNEYIREMIHEFNTHNKSYQEEIEDEHN